MMTPPSPPPARPHCIQLEQKIKEFDELMVAYRSVSSDRSQSDDEVRSRLAEEVAVKTQLQHQVTELQEFRALYMELRREVQSRENNFRMELDAKVPNCSGREQAQCA